MSGVVKISCKCCRDMEERISDLEKQMIAVVRNKDVNIFKCGKCGCWLPGAPAFKGWDMGVDNLCKHCLHRERMKVKHGMDLYGVDV